jgi:hypothetical protein
MYIQLADDGATHHVRVMLGSEILPVGRQATTPV